MLCVDVLGCAPRRHSVDMPLSNGWGRGREQTDDCRAYPWQLGTRWPSAMRHSQCLGSSSIDLVASTVLPRHPCCRPLLAGIDTHDEYFYDNARNSSKREHHDGVRSHIQRRVRTREAQE